MLEGVPRDADAYLIKRVLMIWSDDAAVRVLRHCAEAIGPEGRVLVVEMVMPSGNEPSPAKNYDLLMLLANEGGRIRTEFEFASLFAEAALRIARLLPTATSARAKAARTDARRRRLITPPGDVTGDERPGHRGEKRTPPGATRLDEQRSHRREIVEPVIRRVFEPEVVIDALALMPGDHRPV